MENLEKEKLIQALNSFAYSSIGKLIDAVKAARLMYFADRYHIRKYGRPIAWIQYIATDTGPINIELYNLLKNKDDTVKLDPSLTLYTGHFISVKPVNRDVLSETDIEALKFAFKNFKDFETEQLTSIAMKYPEWTAHKDDPNITKGTVYIDFKEFFTEGVDSDIKDIIKKDPFPKVDDLAISDYEEELSHRKEEWTYVVES